ncbi:MAG TPA: tripartite tricarboxylate transporter substrate binding protein [Ramlibacter sp.]|nr:tripartite tricarboxylate transporter substrate binding protein [Ramlibacter sp.]
MSRTKSTVLALTLAPFLATAQAAEPASAQSYPTKTIRFIAPFGAGATTDTLARLVASHLGQAMGQTVIVENKPGGSGIIGASAVLSAPADGYTVLVAGSAPLVFNVLTFAKLPYNPDDLVPVTVLAEYPLVIAANIDSKIKSLADITRLASEKPETLGYSYTSPSFKVQVEYLSTLLKVKMLAVPYNGGGAALQAVMAGDTPLIAQDPTSVAPMHKTGKLRAIAVTSKRRNAALPDVPTVAESGVPNFESSLFMGLAVRRGTPPAIVQKLHHEVAKVLALPEVREKIAALGMDPKGSTPEESATKVKRELEQYRPIVEAAGMRASQ